MPNRAINQRQSTILSTGFQPSRRPPNTYGSDFSQAGRPNYLVVRFVRSFLRLSALPDHDFSQCARQVLALAPGRFVCKQVLLGRPSCVQNVPPVCRHLLVGSSWRPWDATATTLTVCCDLGRRLPDDGRSDVKQRRLYPPAHRCSSLFV
ncbi:hypothetical protein FA95DRAFT_705805 [Auriscalpium vulgare]|uniref:Uncharacterized protein n=1 Tax=Auriscalpium vulgare TaxID=40419 RepID=A0ACB8S0P3_9AGAM|nr:hypothetical protein FA95DRAFT_705805 [Auriscalpium vulgare]